MLQVFGFEQVAVVVGDLYFKDPRPIAGQESAERGVRLELRFLKKEDLHGSIYSAQPILVDFPIWRADLLESVDGEPGSHDRTHHHPRFRGWEPGKRTFDPSMSSDPVEFVGRALADVPGLLAQAGLEADAVSPADQEALATEIPEIQASVRRLLARVLAGELGRPPEAAMAGADSIRSGWL